MSNVTEIVTEKIIKQLEQGVKPWDKPWAGGLYFPKNFLSRKHYNGINVLNLWIDADEKGFNSPYWLTYKQAKELGGHIRKGESGSFVLWAAPMPDGRMCAKCEHTRKGGKQCPECGSTQFLSDLKGGVAWKYYKVFNVEQTEGIEYPEPKQRMVHNTLEAIQEAENILVSSGARIIHSGNLRAYYDRKADYIKLPEKPFFKTTEGYYSTALHELTHWTGHESRLNREFGKRFGDQAYAFEELVAELGSAFLSAHVGIHATVENHASYIDNWMQVLRDKPGAMIEACSKASKAFEYLTTQATCAKNAHVQDTMEEAA